ncbi:MAG: hypothetical protein M1541_18330, partial [Acidobacteria bacterium]|nr:hypothetical protein [Acidobacteriota bacterium]
MKQALVLAACAALLPAQTVEVVNNHPFPVREPIGDAMVDVAANARVTLRLPQAAGARELEAAPEPGGLRVRYRGADLGRITWGLLVKAAGAVDQVAEFEPLPFRFGKPARGPLYTDWRAETERAGFALTLQARVWDGGFLDWSMALRNASAEQIYGMYGAVEARWEHPAAKRRLLSYDNRPEDFDHNGRTRFSAGQGRHHALQHGLDWLALDFGASSALILNGFSQLATVLDDARSARHKSPRFTGASLPQFKNEACIAGNALYLVAEFARDNRPYRDRFVENRLPE